MIIIPEELLLFFITLLFLPLIKLIVNGFGFGLIDIFESDEWRDFHFFSFSL